MALWMMTGRLKPPFSSPILSYSRINTKVTGFFCSKGCNGIEFFRGLFDFRLDVFDLSFLLGFNLGLLFRLNFRYFSLSLWGLLLFLLLFLFFLLLFLLGLLGLFGFLLLLLAFLGLFGRLSLMPIL